MLYIAKMMRIACSEEVAKSRTCLRELRTITSSQSINLAFAAAIGYERVENREKGARDDGKTE